MSVVLIVIIPTCHWNQTMDTLFSILFGGGGGRGRRNKPTKKAKKRPDSWFETCTVSQLKDLCKASKLPVSGTMGDLCNRLTSHEVANDYGTESQARLKALCKGKLLIQSGNKFDLVLRLLHGEYSTGTAKTETIVDEATGEEIEVIKKRAKTTPSPQMMYTRVEKKKMNAVAQKKYQTHYGSKRHSPDVYNLMKDLIKEHIIDGKIADDDPILAVTMATAVFNAFNDNWKVMERPGYETIAFRKALDLYADVLKAARSFMNKENIERIVSLLESIDASVEGYCLPERSSWEKKVPSDDSRRDVPRLAGENAIVQTIQIVMPDYDKSTREAKKGTILDRDLRAARDWTLPSDFMSQHGFLTGEGVGGGGD